MDRVEQLKSYLERQPGDSFTRHALAMEYIKRGDDISARGMLEAVLETDPSYTGSYYHLGKLLERAGDPAAAAAVYRKGMEMARKQGDLHAWGELNSALDLAGE